MSIAKLSKDTEDSLRRIVREIDQGHDAEAHRLLDEFSRRRDVGLFQELGRLTRQLHDALNTFNFDQRINGFAERDIPDARERLKFVVAKTEQAAHQALQVVESCMPMADRLRKRSTELRADWDRFVNRQMQPDEFRQLSRAVGEFLGAVGDDAGRMHAGLMEILMAQEFQDLTGQVIQKVITLVQEIEDGLVDLVRVAGRKGAEPAPRPGGLEGPQIKADAPGVVSGQDEVDSLLSSLGF